MIRIALTGGIACGKSLAARLFREQGMAVCEADDLAHALMAPGQAVYATVVKAYGQEILSADGTIDRAVLGRKVFSDPGALQRLNRLVHPAVKQAWEHWLQAQGAPARAAMVVVPLFHEMADPGTWDAVVCVSGQETDQIRRLKERGLTESECRARVAAQLPVARKAERSDYVILNVGSEDLLRQQVEKVATCILES